MLICLQLAACQGPVVELTEVLNYSSCKQLQAGARFIAFEQLGKVRGVTMETQLEAPDQTFLAISRGPQPTSGYAFALTSFDATGHTLVLNLDWLQPDPDSVQVPTPTSPCLVIGIDTQAQIDEVEVRLGGNPFERVSFPNRDSESTT